jgi:hypothetical protein
MGNFTTQGYDIVVEISEREVRRQALARPPFTPDPQPLPSGPGAPEGMVRLRLVVKDVWFRFEPGRPDTFRDDIDAISIRLMLIGEIDITAIIVVTAITPKGLRIEFPYDPIKKEYPFKIPLSALITIDDRLTVQASQAAGIQMRNVVVDFSPDPSHPKEPRIGFEWYADGKNNVIGSPPFILERVKDSLAGNGRTDEQRVKDIEDQLTAGIRDHLVNTLKQISLLPEPIAVNPATTDPFKPSDLAVRTIVADHPYGATLALLVATGCPKETRVVDSAEVASLNDQIALLQESLLEPRLDEDSIKEIRDAIAQLRAQLAAVPADRRHVTITIAPQELNRAGPMSSALPATQDFALSISRWLLLRCVVRQSIIEKLGLAPEDFDPLVPCRLAREIATASRDEAGNVGESFHLTRFEAVVEDDHLRIDGGISKETWAYKGTAGFTLIIRLTLEETEVDSVDVVTRREEIRELRSSIAELDPRDVKGREFIEEEIDRLQREIDAIPAGQRRRKVKVVKPISDAPIIEGPDLELNPLVYIAIILSAGFIGIVTDVLVIIAARILDRLLDAPFGGFVQGGLEKLLGGLPRSSLGDIGDRLQIQEVFIDDLTIVGDLQPPEALGGLVAIDSLQHPLAELLITPQLEGSDTSDGYFLLNRSASPIQVNAIRLETAPAEIFTLLTPLPFTVQPGGLGQFGLRFQPLQSGPIEGQVVIESNDPTQPKLRVRLTTSATPRGPHGRVVIIPSALSFVDIVGRQLAHSADVLNVGERDAQLVAASILEESPPGQFFVSLASLPAPVPPGEVRSLSIVHAPTRPGPAHAVAELRLQGDIAYFETHRIALSATATTPRIVLDPAALDFGAVAVDTESVLAFDIRNDGDASLTVAGIAAVQSGRSFFLDPNLSLPLVVAPQSSQSVQVTFGAGPTPGRSANDEFEIASDDPQQPRVRLRVRGAAGGSHIDVVPDFVEFGLVTAATATSVLTVSNDGSADVQVERISLETGTAFALLGLPTPPFTVAAGQATKFQVLFTAPISGDYIDRVVVRSNDALRPTVRNGIHARR